MCMLAGDLRIREVAGHETDDTRLLATEHFRLFICLYVCLFVLMRSSIKKSVMSGRFPVFLSFTSTSTKQRIKCLQNVLTKDKRTIISRAESFYSYNKQFQREIVNIFLPIILKICFGCSKEPSH